MIEYLDGRVGLMLYILVVAVIQDIKFRKVYDIIWWFGITAGVVLQILDPIDWLVFGSSLVVVPLALFLGKKGVFGMADAYALITIAVLTPLVSYSEDRLLPFTVLINAGILSISVIAYCLIRNLRSKIELPKESRLKRIRRLFTSYYAEDSKHTYAFTGDMPNANVHNFVTRGWVTPAIPFLFFILLGFLIQIFHGSIISV